MVLLFDVEVSGLRPRWMIGRRGETLADYVYRPIVLDGSRHGALAYIEARTH